MVHGTIWAKWLFNATLAIYIWISYMESQRGPEHWNIGNGLLVVRRSAAMIGVILQMTLQKPSSQTALSIGGLTYFAVWCIQFADYAIIRSWYMKHPDQLTEEAEVSEQS